MIDRTIYITVLNEDTLSLSGYAHGYEETPQVGFTERIPRETFEDALTHTDSNALVLDFGEAVIADTGTGTLLLSLDEHGLKVEALVAARYENDLDNCEFAVSHNDLSDEWIYDKAPAVGKHRTITKLRLIDIGVIQKPPEGLK